MKDNPNLVWWMAGWLFTLGAVLSTGMLAGMPIWFIAMFLVGNLFLWPFTLGFLFFVL